MNPREAAQEGIFHFDPRDGIYRDHFPGYPVVPGSLIIQAFLEVAGSAQEIEEFRFRSFVSPGCYHYRVTCRGDRWDCMLFQENRILVRGKLKG